MIALVQPIHPLQPLVTARNISSKLEQYHFHPLFLPCRPK